MNHIGLFEGIGGFSLAAHWMGWETVAWCEWNKFGQQVLKNHFPNAEGYGDIKKTEFKKYANTIDVLTGGFPCQPYSEAGKRLGNEDDRHLWPQMLRAIREIQPRYVVGENVRGLTNWNGGLVFDEVQADLEAEGYEVLPFLLPACAVNAPHRRDRIWLIAYSGSYGFQGRNKELQEKRKYGHDEKDSASELWGTLPFGPNDLPAPRITGKDDGLPDRVDRIKALGNAIVPHVAYQIFKAIEQHETTTHNHSTGSSYRTGAGMEGLHSTGRT